MKLFKSHKQHIVTVICLLFILLFTYAAVSKLLSFEKFKVQLEQSFQLGFFANGGAWIILMTEIFVSLLLMIPRFRLAALYSSLSLMILFTAYIVVVSYFSPNVPCSCGGVLEGLGWMEHLVFNLFFIALGITGIVLYTKINTTSHV